MASSFNILRRKGVRACLESPQPNRRWFCQTAAIYYLGLFPTQAIDNPRSFAVLPSTKIILGPNKAPFLFSTRRSFGTQQSTQKEVLSALQSLVSRLDEWEPNLVAPQREAEVTEFSITTPIKSSEMTTTLSIEEYARIFGTGYPLLPPLQLGWIATTSFPEESFSEWDCPRTTVLYFLAKECGLPESTALLALLQDCQANPALLERLQKAWTPKYEEIFQCLLEQNSGQTLPLLVQLRGDILRLMTVLPKESTALKTSLQQLEGHLRRLLSTWFSPGMLDIRRITYNTTSAGIIEKIAIKEAVHPMKSLDDLRRRLGPKRRVFALFHPLMPDEPLVILHVHLESQPNHIPSAMTHVLTEDPTEIPLQPLVATFYSISNTQTGLTRGLGLGEFLIKQAVQQLQQEFPSGLETFVTLSPMPGFRKWLEGVVQTEISSDTQQIDQVWAEGLVAGGIISPNSIPALTAARPLLQELLACTKGNVDNLDEHNEIEQKLHEARESLMVLAAHYLVRAKNPRSGKPLDPVTGFHTHNGAEVYRINFAADLSRKGLMRSLGVMANYRYVLNQIETNKARLESSHYAQIPMSVEVRELLPT